MMSFIFFFIVTNDINHIVILSTPFINMISPYKTNHESIISKINGLKLVFPFLEKPKTRNLNLNKACFIHTHHMNTLIREKQYHLVYFRQYDFLQKNEQQLQNLILQKRILEFQSKIEKKICSDLPNAF